MAGEKAPLEVIEEVFALAVEHASTSLAKWYRKHELSLRKTATDREKNQVVAVAVLKLLETDPQHWQAISYLNQWDKNRELSFEAYLLDWYRRVPKPQKSFVADVAALFEISLRL